MLNIHDWHQSALDPFATNWAHERQDFIAWRFKIEAPKLSGRLTLEETRKAIR